MKPIYIVIFTDNSTFEGGTNYFNTKWNEIPRSKRIRTILYRLTDNSWLTLSGYEKYCHIVEGVVDVNKGSNVKVENVYILGKIFDRVEGYKINFVLNKIDRLFLSVNDKFIKQINSKYWI